MPREFPFPLSIVDVRVLLCVFLGAAVSCSIVLPSDATQCREDGDCTHFGNASCNLATGLCVPRTPTNGTGMDAARTDGAGSLPDAGGGADALDARANPLCPDLDNNRVLDCTESLLINPDFATGVTPWKPEAAMVQGFDPRDGNGQTGSGSIAVTNAATTGTGDVVSGGSQQCVATGGALGFSFYSQSYLDTPQAAAGSSMGASFQFFSASDCTGAPSGGFNIAFSDGTVTGWRLLQGALTAPMGTQSLAVRLVVIKPVSAASTRALFDNILLRVR